MNTLPPYIEKEIARKGIVWQIGPKYSKDYQDNYYITYGISGNVTLSDEIFWSSFLNWLNIETVNGVKYIEFRKLPIIDTYEEVSESGSSEVHKLKSISWRCCCYCYVLSTPKESTYVKRQGEKPNEIQE